MSDIARCRRGEDSGADPVGSVRGQADVPPPCTEPPSATRRQVLAFLGGAAALLSLGASRSVSGGGAGQEGLHVGSAKDLVEGTVLESSYYGLPLLILSLEDEVTAVSGMCTHEGCLLTWSTERFVFLCPCHGGEFDRSGSVLAGPPPAALLRFPVRIEQGEIYVLDPEYGD